jgi:hypothetical protein
MSAQQYLSDWNAGPAHDLLIPQGRWCHEFFDKWAPYIASETGVKIHDDDGFTRLDRYALGRVCALRSLKK